MYDHSNKSFIVRTGIKRTRAEFEGESAPVFHKTATTFSLFQSQDNALSNPLVARIWKAVHGVDSEGPSRLEQDVRRVLKKGKSPGRLLRSVRNLTSGVGPRKKTTTLPLLTMQELTRNVPLHRVKVGGVVQNESGFFLGQEAGEPDRQRRKICLVKEQRQQLFSPVVAAF